MVGLRAHWRRAPREATATGGSAGQRRCQRESRHIRGPKTTTVDCLVGLRQPGWTPTARTAAVAQLDTAVVQSASLPEHQARLGPSAVGPQ